MTKLKFTEKDVRVLKGLQAIREKASMYIGPIDSYGIFTIIREPLDNGVDEVEAGRATKLYIMINKDGSVSIHDDGQGMPVGKHHTEKVSTLQVLTGMLHAGGKLGGGSAYKNSRGTHGVGQKCTNALSEYFIVETCRDGKWYRIEYECGELIEACHRINKPSKHPFKTGTTINFKPDLSCFDKGSKLDVALLIQWCETASYFNPGLHITLNAMKYSDKYKEKIIFHQPLGIDQWLLDRETALKATRLEYEDNLAFKGAHYDLALAFTDAEGINVEGYCNGLPQVDGGIHLQAISKIIYTELSKRAKKTQKFDQDSILEGIIGVINFKVDAPRFSGQTKEKLADTRFNDLCADDIADGITKYFNKNKALATSIIERAAEYATMKHEFKLATKAARELKKVKKLSKRYDAKVSRAKSHIPFSEREVFLVEGDSAGGGARTVKYDNQTVVYMKGKIVNVLKAAGSKNKAVRESYMMNEEILSILSAIGYDPDAKDPLEHLECGKIILLSDSDPDGYHINTLEITALYHIAPKVIDAGMVFAVKSPRYCLNHKGKYYTSGTLSEMKEKAPDGADLKHVSYLKGWGEVQATVLRDIALRPGTRQLIKLLPPTRKEAKEFELLMGEDTYYRKVMFDML